MTGDFTIDPQVTVDKTAITAGQSAEVNITAGKTTLNGKVNLNDDSKLFLQTGDTTFNGEVLVNKGSSIVIMESPTGSSSSFSFEENVNLNNGTLSAYSNSNINEIRFKKNVSIIGDDPFNEGLSISPTTSINNFAIDGNLLVNKNKFDVSNSINFSFGGTVNVKNGASLYLNTTTLPQNPTTATFNNTVTVDSSYFFVYSNTVTFNKDVSVSGQFLLNDRIANDFPTEVTFKGNTSIGDGENSAPFTSATIQSDNIHFIGNGNGSALKAVNSYITVSAAENLTANNKIEIIDTKYNEASFSAKMANVKALSATNAEYFKWKVDESTINGQISADNAQMEFRSSSGQDNGSVTINVTDDDAITATNSSDSATSIFFHQPTTIKAQNNLAYAESASGQVNTAAIKASGNSIITLFKAQELYGDLVANKAAERMYSPQIVIHGMENGKFVGDVLAYDKGTIDISLESNSSYEGRFDDYSSNQASRPNDINGNAAESGNIKFTLSEGSTWYSRAQSYVTDLTTNGGTIDLTRNNGQSSVTIDKLSGKATASLSLDAVNHGNGDMLYINDANDVESLTVNVGWLNGTSYADLAKGDRVRFATINGDISGRLTAQTVGQGIINTQYLIVKDYDAAAEKSENDMYNEGKYKPGSAYVDETFASGTNYYIINPNGPEPTPEIPEIPEQPASKTGQTVLNMSRANYANAVYMDTLNKRQGEARYTGSGNHGVWVRVRHDTIGKEDAFRSHNTMAEVGFEQRDVHEYGEFRTGFAFDYMNGSVDYHTVNGDGDMQRYGLWLYTTYLGNDGQYADLVLKYGHLKNDFDVTSELNEKISGDYSNDAASLSAEYGWKFSNSQNYYVEPQAQLQYTYITGADYTTSQGSKVELDSIHSLIGRIGFRAGKDFNTETPITAYIRGDVLHELLGEQDILAYDNTGVLNRTYHNDDTWYSAGLGISVQSSENTYFFLEGEQVFGADNDSSYTVSGGFKHSF